MYNPTMCGFFRVGVYQILNDYDNTYVNTKDIIIREPLQNRKGYDSTLLHKRFDVVVKEFTNSVLDVDYEVFVNTCQKVTQLIQTIGKNSANDRRKIMDVFSLKNWRDFTVEEQNKHSLYLCDGCMKDKLFKSTLSLFVQAIRSKVLKKKAENIWSKPARIAKVKAAQATDHANKIIKKLNTEFQKDYNIKFSEIVHTNENCKDSLKVAMKDIEKQKAETSVLRTFGSNISLATRTKNIKHECFETKADAIKRTEREALDLSSGKRKQHCHVKLENIEWMAEECINEVINYPDGKQINYSKLARDYQLKYKDGNIPTNAGYCMKELLKKSNVDLLRFGELNRRAFENDEIRVRKKRRTVLDTNISIPQEETIVQIKCKVKKLIAEGKIVIGDLIVPQKFKRKFLKDGNIVDDEYEIYGRRVPFHLIRESLLKRHQHFMRLRQDEEYLQMSRNYIISDLKRINEYEDFDGDFDGDTPLLLNRLKQFERKRHLAVWHDTAPISNHSHLLITVNVVYDPAIFLTDDEYRQKYKKRVNVQALVEDPVWYIFGRCPPSDNQIMYCQT